MNENVIDGETTETTEADQQLEQLREALRVQAVKTAYWRQKAQGLDDQVLELGIRAGDIKIAD